MTSSAYAARLSLVDLEKQNKTYANTSNPGHLVLVFERSGGLEGLFQHPRTTITAILNYSLFERKSVRGKQSFVVSVSPSRFIYTFQGHDSPNSLYCACRLDIVWILSRHFDCGISESSLGIKLARLRITNMMNGPTSF